MKEFYYDLSLNSFAAFKSAEKYNMQWSVTIEIKSLASKKKKRQFSLVNMTDPKLPENVELLRTRVVIEKDRVYSV